MIEIENCKDLHKQIPVITEKKLSQLLLLGACLLAAQSTNLSKAAKRMSKVVGQYIKYETAYKKLLVFFQTGNTVGIFQFVCILAINTFCHSTNCYLLLDRTNWKFGKVNVNLLVIGLVYRDVFIPLVWTDLGRAGNSNAKQRLDLLDQLLSWWSLSSVPLPKLHIAGDREFIGFKWFRGLVEREIEFVMRIPKSLQLEAWFNGKIKDRKLGLKVFQRYMGCSGKDYVEVVFLSELILKLTIIENDSTRAKASHIFLITDMDDLTEVSKFYRKRYKIEVCFKHLKKCGLGLEDLSLVGQHKIDLMFAVLTLVYLMAIQKGIIHFEEQEPQEMKIYDVNEPQPYIAPAKSVFMQGMEDLLALVFSFKEFLEHLGNLISWKAKPQHPLYQHFYTLKNFILQ